MKSIRCFAVLIAMMCAITSLFSCVAEDDSSAPDMMTGEVSDADTTTDEADADSTAHNTTDDTTTVDDDAVVGRFIASKKELSAHDSIDLSVNVAREYASAGVEYKEITTKNISYAAIGKESFCARVESVTRVADEQISSLELFSDGVAVFEFSGDSRFYYCEMTAEQYIGRMTPIDVIDTALYSKVSVSGNEADGYILSFSEPLSRETWAVSEEVMLVSAEGVAFMSGDGKIERMSYCISFEKGELYASYTYDVTYSKGTLVPSELGMPQSTTKVETDDIDIPYLIEYARAVLGISENVLSSHLTEIDSTASGHRYDGEFTCAYLYSADTARISERISIELAGLGAYGTISELLYKDGITKSSENGADLEVCDTTLSDILEYLFEMNFRNVHDLHEMSGLRCEYEGGVITVYYDLPLEYGYVFENKINDMLYGDEDYLDSFAEAYSTIRFCGYVSIDELTGMIVAAGTEYEGMHVIGGQGYSLLFSESFTITSSTERISEFVNYVEHSS